MRPTEPPDAALPIGGRPPRDRFWHRVGRQLAHPEGAWGRLAGRFMVWANAGSYRAALDALDLDPRDHVLEIGCGPGAGVAALASGVEAGRIAGLDDSAEMVRVAIRRNRAAIARDLVTIATGDFRRLPWVDASFDKLLAVNVAYFFDAEGIAVAEMVRVLRPRGQAVLYVTDRATMRRWPFAGSDTHVTYGAGDLRRLLLSGGFETVEIQHVRLPMGVRGLIAIATRSSACTTLMPPVPGAVGSAFRRGRHP